MEPIQSYRIWFTQRSGSTLLCKGLEATNLAGMPGEFFNLMEAKTLCEKYNVNTYEELKTAIWKLGTSSNGIFGIKHSLHTTIYTKLFKELQSLQGIDTAKVIDEEALLKDLFPNCKHIFLTRRNKIRQAVSWWKAIKDNLWHLEGNQTNTSEASFYEQHYDFDALSHLFKETMLKECAIQAYFSKFGIQVHTIVYEDFIQNFNGTLKQILEYLNIPSDHLPKVKKHFKKTANEHSEKWVQRFRKDLQEQMGHVIW